MAALCSSSADAERREAGTRQASARRRHATRGLTDLVDDADLDRDVRSRRIRLSQQPARPVSRPHSDRPHTPRAGVRRRHCSGSPIRRPGALALLRGAPDQALSDSVSRCPLPSIPFPCCLFLPCPSGSAPQAHRDGLFGRAHLRLGGGRRSRWRSRGAHDPGDDADAIAVLGAAQYNGRPSPVSARDSTTGGRCTSAGSHPCAGDRRRGIGRHGERIGSGSALPSSRPDSPTAPSVGLPAAATTSPRSNASPVGSREDNTPGLLLCRRLSHAAAPVIATRLGLLPSRRRPNSPIRSNPRRNAAYSSPKGSKSHTLGLQPLRVPMQRESRRVYTGRVVAGPMSTRCDSPTAPPGSLEIIPPPGRPRHRAVRLRPQGIRSTILYDPPVPLRAGGPLWEIPAGTLNLAKIPRRAPAASCSKRRGSPPRLQRLTRSGPPGLHRRGQPPVLGERAHAGTPSARARRVHRVVPQPLSQVWPAPDGEVRDAKTVVAILIWPGFVLGMYQPDVPDEDGRSARLDAGS